MISRTVAHLPQPIILIWFNSEAILLGLKQDPEVAHLAATYLKYAVIGLPAYTFNAISRYVALVEIYVPPTDRCVGFRRYFQSQGQTSCYPLESQT